jgi:hypothetical protein
MRATQIAIIGIIIMGTAALVLSLGVILANALTAKDAEVYKSCLIVTAVAGSAVSGLTGFISGYHAGAHGASPVPETPTGSINEGKSQK